MNPVYISVDAEFTHSNLAYGALMQVGMKARATNHTFGKLLPVSTDTAISAWVWENLKPLVLTCFSLSAQHSGETPVMLFGKFASGTKRNIAAEIAEWVLNERRAAYWLDLGVDISKGFPATAPEELEEYPAVMVTYCGGNDYAYINGFLGKYGYGKVFHYNMVDISSLALGMFTGISWNDSYEPLIESLGLEPQPEETKHDAVADASFQLEVFNRLLFLRGDRPSDNTKQEQN